MATANPAASRTSPRKGPRARFISTRLIRRSARGIADNPEMSFSQAKTPGPASYLLTNSILHLAGKSENRLNYLAGQAASLPNDNTQFPVRDQLFTPRDEPQQKSSPGRRVDRPLHRKSWRLSPPRPAAGPVLRGFAVNLPVEVGDLSRLTPAELDTAGRKKLPVRPQPRRYLLRRGGSRRQRIFSAP